MMYHVLNGDSLAAIFKESNLPGQVLVCRECLINGPVASQSRSQFWEERATFLANSYHSSREEYFQKVVQEMEKLTQLPDTAEIYLWFEDDLFCQTNLWFILSLLATRRKWQRVYRIFPVIKKGEDNWLGFGLSTPQRLEQAYEERVPFTEEDVALGANLWTAYQQQDAYTFQELSKSTSACFQHLEEVCQAQLDRIGRDGEGSRPERVVGEIIHSGITEFHDVFKEFFRREGIYGFGDVQVKKMYDQLMQARHK